MSRVCHKQPTIVMLGCAMLLLSLMGVAGCSHLPGATSATGGTGVQIDWVDFMQFAGIRYLAEGEKIQPDLLGLVFARVKFKLEDNVHDPNYRSKDGDAAFLDSGTVVYSVKGYRPSFRLAVYQDGSPMLFEADSNPIAKRGSDLLDLAGKVRAIGVNSALNARMQLGVVKDPSEVAALVSMALSASVNQNVLSSDGTRYVVVFYFNDGTTSSRMFWLNSGELQRGILMPKAFGAVIQSIAVK